MVTSGIGVRLVESVIAIAVWLFLMRLLMGIGGGGRGGAGSVGGPRVRYGWREVVMKVLRWLWG